MANKAPPLLGSGKSQDHTCSVMESLPRATHPGNHKWTEPTGLKVVELGCVSLSSWDFVRSRLPLATEMSSTCVCVQLENVLCIVGYSIMRSVGGKSTCSILVTYIDRLQTYLRQLLCSGLECPTLSQLLSQSHIFDCCKKLLQLYPLHCS